tara:strand:+ start:260 stop:544 length:285 start_codon:yes stop_codon:yes gene_type:complete
MTKDQKIQNQLQQHLTMLKAELKNAQDCQKDWYDLNPDLCDENGNVPMKYVMELVNVSNRVHSAYAQIRVIEDVLGINKPTTAVIYRNRQQSYV